MKSLDFPSGPQALNEWPAVCAHSDWGQRPVCFLSALESRTHRGLEAGSGQGACGLQSPWQDTLCSSEWRGGQEGKPQLRGRNRGPPWLSFRVG